MFEKLKTKVKPYNSLKMKYKVTIQLMKFHINLMNKRLINKEESINHFKSKGRAQEPNKMIKINVKPHIQK